MLTKAAELVARQAASLGVLTRAGVVAPFAPTVLADVTRALLDWGRGPAGGFLTLAHRFPTRTGLVDEAGELSFVELHQRSTALAHSLRAMGVVEEAAVALLARNHRGFVETTVAVAKLGADIVYLNTASSAAEIRHVCLSHRVSLLVHDAEFGALLDGAGLELDRVIAWSDVPTGVPASAQAPHEPLTLEALIASGSTVALAPPRRRGRTLILTSGTTGPPKGAARAEGSLDAGVALLSRLPLRAGWRSHVAAPLFHTWGWAHLNLAMLTGTTVVLRRGFEPEDCLRTVVEQQCDSLVVVPVMLQRILRLPEATLASYDLSQVKVVASSGSALPGGLATRWMDRFGDTLYNVYGSTEVAWATIAKPQDLRSVPGTAGKPPLFTTVRVYDEQGMVVPTGTVGHVLVGNSMLLERYTTGGADSRAMVDGLMATGDLGRFDADGRLTVEGRADDMVVSGGENVLPAEVEECLLRHEAVVEAAVVGVPDEEFGQCLAAFLVMEDGAAVSPEDLRRFAKERLAGYKVPKRISLVDTLPRNVAGKVVKRRLVDVSGAAAGGGVT